MGNNKRKALVVKTNYVGATHFCQAKRNEDDEDDDIDAFNKMVIKPPLPYKAFECVRQQQITTYYLSKAIGEPDGYVEMIHRIRTAQPQDVIYIHMNTTGGRLDTGIQLINAMKSSEGRIVAVLDAKAFSLGTLIFLAADEFVVHDDIQFMIHNFSSVTHGKGNEQESELIATLAWFKKMAQKYYVPFLTKEELDGVLSGKDLWMGADEVRKRLQRMVDIQNGVIPDPDKKPKTAKAPKTLPNSAKKDPSEAAKVAEVTEDPAILKKPRTSKATQVK